MRLLVTRPEPDALKLAARLETMGHEATVAPLMAVTFDDCDTIDLSEVTALVATSRNGLAALKAQGAHRIGAQLPLFVVGGATEREAQRLGFAHIVTGGGTVSSLLPAILAHADPQSDVLLHLAGDEVAGALDRELDMHGYRVVTAVVYRMVAAAEFSRDVAEQIEIGEIDGVMLFSPRTARIFAALVVKHDLLRAAQRMAYYCLSDAVAAQLKPLAPVRIEIAETPTLDAMLDMLA